MQGRPSFSRISHPYYVLGLLFFINLLNYIDRQVLYAVFPLIKPDLGLSDTELGALASAFMIVYMCAAPLAGYWGDRTARNRWIAGGVGLWSLATVFSGLSRSYSQLLTSRSFIGVGEACYGSIAPSFIAEHFSQERRGRVLAFFYMAIPVGSAIGYVLGGLLGGRWGWRVAFYMVGLPGIFAAVLAWFLKDPRGSLLSDPSRHPSWRDYAGLFKNKVYVMDTLAGAAMTFALGGLAAWMPSFFVRNWAISVAQAGAWFGGVTVVAGALGSLAGGWLGDWLLKYTYKSYFLLSAAGLLISIPFGAGALLISDFHWALASLFLAEFFIFLNTGPLNALLVNCTSVSIRSMAFAVNIFIIHALGDAFSPTLIGYVSDLTSLKTALLLPLGALSVAGLFCVWGSFVMTPPQEN